jgi:hypothetical protein
MFGTDGNSITSANQCLSYANVAGTSTCIAAGGDFPASNKDLVFGPVPGPQGPPPSTMTISHLAAAAETAASPVTITVLDNGAPTTPPLTCTTTPPATTCTDDADTATVNAGDFLQVSVTGGADWLVTFELG